MAETRNYKANAAGSPPSKPSSPSTGYPQTKVSGVTEATVPGPYWYYQIAEEIRNAILAGGLTPSDGALDQIKAVLDKGFGRTNNGDPNGAVAADRVHERCWDVSGLKPIPYVAVTADGTIAGTEWVPEAALSPTPVGMRNGLINGDFRINQRGVATGAALALSDGEYFFDRWRSVGATAGIQVATDGTVTLGANEGIEQVIEGRGSDNVGWAQPGEQVTVSVADPSADLTVTLLDYSETDTASGTISSGSGRQSVTLTVPALDLDGHLIVRVEDASGAGASFAKVQIEHGAVATPFERRPWATEHSLCWRYYRKWDHVGVKAGGHNEGSTVQYLSENLCHEPMRAAPSFTRGTEYIYSSFGSRDTIGSSNLGTELVGMGSGESPSRTDSVLSGVYSGTGDVYGFLVENVELDAEL